MKELKGIKIGDVVHTPTKELAEKVTDIFHNAGYTWACGTSLKKELNFNYGEEHCYRLRNAISYSPKPYYRDKGFKIIAAEEFIKLNSLKRDEVYLELVDSATCKEIARILEGSGEEVYYNSMNFLKEGRKDEYTYISYYNNNYWCLNTCDKKKTKITIEELKQLVGFKTEPSMKNQYIKCLSPEHGKRIIAYFESKGAVNPQALIGEAVNSYYGTDKDDAIGCYRNLPSDGIEIFLPEESYTITRKALSEVYPLIHNGCQWRKTVEAILNTNLFAEEFTVSKERVLEAYSEANPKQLEWLNKYLPKPKTVKVVEYNEWRLANDKGTLGGTRYLSREDAVKGAKGNQFYSYPVNLTGTFEIEE